MTLRKKAKCKEKNGFSIPPGQGRGLYRKATPQNIKATPATSGGDNHDPQINLGAKQSRNKLRE